MTILSRFFVILLLSAATEATAQEPLKQCWKTPRIDCGIRSNVTLRHVENACPGIDVHDEELYEDLVQCGGVMMCWLMFDKVRAMRETASASVIIALSHNLQLSPLQIEMAKKDGSGGPFGSDICRPLQNALNEMMPLAINHLR